MPQLGNFSLSADEAAPTKRGRILISGVTPDADRGSATAMLGHAIGREGETRLWFARLVNAILPKMPTFLVVHGSLTDGAETVLVNASNTNCELGSGVSGAIRRACGLGYQEHIMAALAGFAIHNALIEIDGPEVPILDGSSVPFVEGFLAAGLEEQDLPNVASRTERPPRTRPRIPHRRGAHGRAAPAGARGAKAGLHRSAAPQRLQSAQELRRYRADRAREFDPDARTRATDCTRGALRAVTNGASVSSESGSIAAMRFLAAAR